MWTLSGGEISPVRGEAKGEVKTVREMTVEELPTVFQPIVDLETGRTLAYEALVRPTVSDYASPIALFEHAQEQGTVGRLGRTIRESAFYRCPDDALFVNIHPQELMERWLVRPDDPIAFHQHAVFLEVTESATLEYFDLCMSVLKEVCARTGAYLVIDDLGAGYSNLVRVADLAPQVVKLDRSLVMGLPRSPRKQTVVRHLVGMCAELGAKVVAEGIESVDEMLAVRDAGAHYGQGYLLARPAYPKPTAVWPDGIERGR
jgi:EAL domain-containing protein (putative c-di-GMP-specific phosphodiesterase class I)